MHKTSYFGALLCAALAFVPANLVSAAPAKKAPVKGTQQMAGGGGQFGQTYTLVGGGDYGPINFTLVSAEYSVQRINMAPGNSYAPKAGEKLLVIRYKIKNPNKEDFYYSSRNLFQTVDANDTTALDAETSRRESQKDLVAYSIKPGQGIEDLITYAVIPAQGAIPKLILQLGKAGTGDLVTRYMLGSGANTVKPIPAPYADPADPSGASARQEVPAQLATVYNAGFFDMSLDSVAFAPGPFGDLNVAEGKRFLVATVTATNKTWDKIYFNQTMVPTLMTSDDEKVTDCDTLKGKRDEPFEGRQIDAGETVTLRFAFQLPMNVNGKSLSIAEALNNSGDLSRAFVYDISAVK